LILKLNVYFSEENYYVSFNLFNLSSYDKQFHLTGDRTAISETRLQRNFVVQVILQDQPMPPNGAITTTGHLITNHDHMNYSIRIEQT